MDSTNKIRCIICSEETTALKPADSVVAEIFLELFQNFANSMNWNMGKNCFDFNHDPFPFCQLCKVVLVELSSLSEEMERVYARLQAITANAAAKIILSNLNNKGLIVADEDESDGKLEETEGLSCFRKMEYFRKQTIDEYSPDVTINKTDPEMKKRKRRKVKANDERVGRKFLKIRFADSIEGFKLGVPATEELSTFLPYVKQEPEESGGESWDDESHELEWMQQVQHVDKKKKERFPCSKCSLVCTSKFGLGMHETLTCGKYNMKDCLIQIDDVTFSYEGLPLMKTNGRFSCGTCGDTFKTKQYTLYHIGKVHLGNLLLTDDSANNEDLVTDIKPPLEVMMCIDNYTKTSAVKVSRKNFGVHTKKKLLNKKQLQENVLKLYANMFRMQL